MNQPKPCESREHIESIERPGYCCWCDQPMHVQRPFARYPLAAFGPPGCPDCGMRAPVDADHAPRCKRRPSDTIPSPPMPGPGPKGAALAELAECGSDMATLIVAVAAGATLQLGPIAAPAYPAIWRGTLQDDARHVAEGNDLLLVVHQLADNWRHR